MLGLGLGLVLGLGLGFSVRFRVRFRVRVMSLLGLTLHHQLEGQAALQRSRGDLTRVHARVGVRQPLERRRRRRLAVLRTSYYKD